MIENNGDKENTDFDEVDETSEVESLEVEPSSSDEIPDIGGDTMVDISGVLAVEELVAKIDAGDPDEAAHKREVRRRVEEVREQHDEELDSTFNFNLDDEF